MPYLRVFEDESLEASFGRCFEMIEALQIKIGMTFLETQNSSIEELSEIRHLVSPEEFFVCGEILAIQPVISAFSEPGILGLFVTTIDSKERLTLSFDRPSPSFHGRLGIRGGSSLREMALESLPSAVRGPSEGRVSIGLTWHDEFTEILSAALSDLVHAFESTRPLVAEFTGDLETIVSLGLTEAIRENRQLAGYIGFGPKARTPKTNIKRETLPILIQALSRFTSGKIRFCWQIVGIGEKTYEGWHLLELTRDGLKSGKSRVRIYSLSSIPVGLVRAAATYAT